MTRLFESDKDFVRRKSFSDEDLKSFLSHLKIRISAYSYTGGEILQFFFKKSGTMKVLLNVCQEKK